MATYVLVPGFWLGGWAWEEVARELRAGGHDVHQVTLTGLAERAAEAGPGTDLETHITDITALIEDADLRKVVLVAHSGGTNPVTGAADRLPDRVRRVVYVDCGPMPDGMAQLDFHEPAERAAVRHQIAAEGGGRWVPVPSFTPGGQEPGELAGLTPEHLAELRERGTPHPAAAAAQPLHRPARLPDHPRTLIACTFPVAAVEHLVAGGNPVFALMAGPEWTYRELPTGHWPMFSRPRELAALLAEAA
ncbi:alpha/beta hydrolase [Actinomadura craniellae]|uniref:Alpha/beta hydrolase n=1 Tax=Actinomadura craniellae TaxID=2231787 RepID=A0A365H4V8_9ACTN|nr:alpha/beta hydrolase [Actinomadura craniellae]RAY14144.1 alpha/beta hydrolase [Actinomadura craniellae]